MKNIFNTLQGHYNQVKQHYRSGEQTEIDSEIFQVLEEDLNAVENSIEYWHEIFQIYEAIISNLDTLIDDFTVLEGRIKGDINTFDMPYGRDRIKSLGNKQNILTINQIETVLEQAQNLESLEEKRQISSQAQSYLENVEKNHKKLAESLDNLEAEKKSIDKRFRSNSKKLQKLKELAETIVRQTSSQEGELATEKHKLAKEVIYIIEYADNTEKGSSITRRKFLFAVAATGIGINKFTDLDQKIYSDFNRAANNVAFELMGAKQSTDPEAYYYDVVDKQKLEAFNKVIEGKEVKIRIYNLGIGQNDIPNYPQSNIIGYLRNQFWKGLEIKTNIQWENNVLTEDHVKNPVTLRSSIADINLRNMNDREVQNFLDTLGTLANTLKQNEDICCIITEMGAGLFQPRSAGGGDCILINREDPNTLKYVLAHEIGHLIGLPHNHGTDVMSYSPERLLRGETGTLNNAFNQESRRKLEIIKNIHRSNT